MLVEIEAEVVHHPLPDRDRRSVVHDAHDREERVQEHEAEAHGGEERPSREYPDTRDGDRFPADDVVDDQLQRPRLQELASADQQHLRDREREPHAIRAQVVCDRAQQREASRAARCAGSGSVDQARHSTAVSPICCATISSTWYMTRPTTKL